ncbi:MAG: hypothetical protein ACKOFF_09115 [Acidimicrobiales bacterium]
MTVKVLAYVLGFTTALQTFGAISIKQIDFVHILAAGLLLALAVVFDVMLRTYEFGVPGEFDQRDELVSTWPAAAALVVVITGFVRKDGWILYLGSAAYLAVSLVFILLLTRYPRFVRHHGLVATSILIDKQASFETGEFHLVLNEKLNMWLCPGGHIDDHRPPLVQLSDKIREESGYEVDFPFWLETDVENLNNRSDFPKVIWATPPTFVLIEDLSPTGCTRGHIKHFDLIYTVFIRSVTVGMGGAMRYQGGDTLRIPVSQCLGGRENVEAAFGAARGKAKQTDRGTLPPDMAERLARVAEIVNATKDNLYGTSSR